jgi:hypothetical protein
MNITAELCMMRNLWHDMEEGLYCHPRELYNDITAKGYDWDLLMDTRGYWVPLEEEAQQKYPFLSSMDMLNIRAGAYHPYWYDEAKALKDKQAGVAAKTVVAKSDMAFITESTVDSGAGATAVVNPAALKAALAAKMANKAARTAQAA